MTEIYEKISQLTASNIGIEEEIKHLKNTLYSNKKKIKTLEENKQLLED